MAEVTALLVAAPPPPPLLATLGGTLDTANMFDVLKEYRLEVDGRTGEEMDGAGLEEEALIGVEVKGKTGEEVDGAELEEDALTAVEVERTGEEETSGGGLETVGVKASVDTPTSVGDTTVVESFTITVWLKLDWAATYSTRTTFSTRSIMADL